MLPKLNAGDKVAILSLSFAAGAFFPHVFEKGLQRLREVFHLEPIEFPTTRKLHAPFEERKQDLIEAFTRPDIKGIISTLGGDEQVEYIHLLPTEPFLKNPKPFFGYSDNGHFCNFLFNIGIPSYYGGHIMIQFGMNIEMHKYSIDFLKLAMFESKVIQLYPSETFTEVELDWGDINNMNKPREYQKNTGWIWSGSNISSGILWGGCLESIDEILRCNTPLPSLETFSSIILFTETCEEVTPSVIVHRVFRALGQRGILSACKGFLIGRAKAWNFDKQNEESKREQYRSEQYKITMETIRKYNPSSPIVLNIDFGHTDPQIPIPFGKKASIDPFKKIIECQF